jgi:hypothetical protein
VAAVALLLLDGQDDRRPNSRPAPFRTWNPPDMDDIRVAMSARSGRRTAAHAASATGRPGVTVRTGLDLLLDVALRDVVGARQVALLPLGRLADVDDGGGARGEGVDLLRADFPDLRARRRRSA